MIRAVHTIIYSDDAAATRRWLSEVLGFPSIGGENPQDWLIFSTGPSETGVHPTAGEGWSTSRHHEIALLCDRLDETVAQIVARGGQLDGEVTDRGFGRAVSLRVPGADSILLYEPHHETAYDFRTPDMGIVPPGLR